MTKQKKLDIAYGKELDMLYKMAVKLHEVVNAMCLLDKKRNLDLYMDKPDKEKKKE